LNKIILTVLAVLVIALGATACSNQSDIPEPAEKETGEIAESAQVNIIDPDTEKLADAEARAMMEKYNLHPVGAAAIGTMSLDNPKVIGLVNDVSREIGLDSSEYEGKELNSLSYVLEERSQNDKGEIRAYFLFDGDSSVAAAYLTVEGYMPGIVSLADRYFFYPGDLKPDKLSFEGIKEIGVSGPWKERDWESLVTLSDPKKIDSFASLFERSVPRKGHLYPPTLDDEYYLVSFRYETGSVVRVRVGSYGTDYKFTIDTFDKWHYEPPKELITEITRLLKAKTN